MNADRPQTEPVTTDLPVPPAVDDQRHATADFAPGADTTQERVPAAPLGTLGRYQLQRLLGEGGMGAVYLAEDGLLQRTVALKVPRLDKNDTVRRARFLREARAAAVLTHPSICPVFDVGEAEGQPYLTMAYVEGASLAQVLRQRGPLPPREAVQLVHTVALAMHHAHQQGILHRDLKPGNIQINAHGKPVVMDFGLAFPLDTETAERLTEHGLVIGTPAYMPPEQINAEKLGPPADVYSLGVVLYELLTGGVPFQGPLGQVMAQIAGSPPPPPRQFRADLDATLERLCLRALAKQPAARFADMAAFAAALDDYLQGKLPSQADSTTVEWRPRRYSQRTIAVVAGLALAALVAGGAGLWLQQTGAQDEDTPPELAGAGNVAAPPKPVAQQPEPAPAPPDEMQKIVSKLHSQLNKPILKISYPITHTDAAPVSRATIPRKLLKDHPGPLMLTVTGTGVGQVVDLTDQMGQVAQVQGLVAGDVTIQGPYWTYLTDLATSSSVYIKSGPGYGILVPVGYGPGSGHVEFEGTHLLLPKTNPDHEIDMVNGTEQAKLRNVKLTQKVTVRFANCTYVIFMLPGTKIIPGDIEQRAKLFPDVHTLLQIDLQRQMKAITITKEQLTQAQLEEKQAGNGGQ